MSAQKRKNKTNLLFWLAFALIVMVVLVQIYYKATDDFRLANITYELPHHKEWEIPPLNAEEKQALDAILNQKFSYIGKGSQSYAFSSEDNQYVLKFFKFKHLKQHWFVELLPSFLPPLSSYRSQQYTRKQRKLNGLFEGYRLAYEVYRPQSGLIYIHLNKSKDLHKILTVYDKIGLPREIDLNQVVFIIQRKGKTTRNILAEDLNGHNLAAAKEHLDKILSFYADEYRLGIFDKDHGVLINTGFLNETPFHLDVGKLTKNEAMKNPAEDLKDITLISDKLKIWLKKNYPENYEELSSFIDTKIQTLYGN